MLRAKANAHNANLNEMIGRTLGWSGLAKAEKVLRMRIPVMTPNPALLIIDVQPRTLSGRRANATLERIVRYVRKRSYPFYVVAQFYADDSSMIAKQTGRAKSREQTGGTDPRILAFLETTDASVHFVEKTTRSVFKAPDFAAVRTAMASTGIREVHVLGYDISDCVLASAYEALDSGYFTYVLEELSHHHLGRMDLFRAATTILRRERMSNHAIANGVETLQI